MNRARFFPLCLLAACLALAACATAPPPGPAHDADPKAMVSFTSRTAPDRQASSASPFTTPARAILSVNVDCKKVVVRKYAGTSDSPVVATEDALAKVVEAKALPRLRALGVEIVPADRANTIVRLNMTLSGAVSVGDLMAGQLGIRADMQATITRSGMVYQLNEGKGIAEVFKLPATKKEGTSLIRLTEKEADEILDQNVSELVERLFIEQKAFFKPLE